MNKDIEINGNMNLGAYSPLELTEEDINESLKEKAVSKAQQRFMGMVHAVQKGELDADEVGSSVAKAAKTMKKKDVKDFAETKHKGLPNHVDENTLVRLIRESIQEHLVDVMKRYTQGKARPEEANKAIMDLANASNQINESDGNGPYYAEKHQMENPKIENKGNMRWGKSKLDERNNQSFYDYADKYMKKNGKKLPDEVLKNAAKKNDERFFNRKK